jgi:hypothetical protein
MPEFDGRLKPGIAVVFNPGDGDNIYGVPHGYQQIHRRKAGFVPFPDGSVYFNLLQNPLVTEDPGFFANIGFQIFFSPDDLPLF